MTVKILIRAKISQFKYHMFLPPASGTAPVTMIVYYILFSSYSVTPNPQVT